MIATIDIDRAVQLIEAAIDDYGKAGHANISEFSRKGGTAAGLLTMARELDGFPPEKFEELRLRMLGCGHLHQLTVRKY
jgi:hypothetical protein